MTSSLILSPGLKALLDELVEHALARFAPDRLVYTGIGSRETPLEVQLQMHLAAAYLGERGFRLRSGGAPGADKAFEAGAPYWLKDIFLPWREFEGSRSPLFKQPARAFEIAAAHHAGWPNMAGSVRSMMARNVQQVLGEKLDAPAAFVLCWTPDGADGTSIPTSLQVTGGTGQAIRIAAAFGVRVENLRRLFPDCQGLPKPTRAQRDASRRERPCNDPLRARTRSELQVAMQGQAAHFLHFFGHRAEAIGSIGPECLSQWYEGAPFVVSNGARSQLYPTCEHYMMARKAALFGDRAMLGRILDAPGPKEAKALGRQVRGFDLTAWEQHRSSIITRGNDLKFRSHTGCRDYLLSTHGRVLVEASPHDGIYGIKLDASHPDARNPANWNGENVLGFGLMEVRDRLLAEVA